MKTKKNLLFIFALMFMFYIPIISKAETQCSSIKINMFVDDKTTYIYSTSDTLPIVIDTKKDIYSNKETIESIKVRNSNLSQNSLEYKLNLSQESHLSEGYTPDNIIVRIPNGVTLTKDDSLGDGLTYYLPITIEGLNSSFYPKMQIYKSPLFFETIQTEYKKFDSLSGYIKINKAYYSNNFNEINLCFGILPSTAVIKNNNQTLTRYFDRFQSYNNFKIKDSIGYTTPVTYKVSFDTNGGSSVADIPVTQDFKNYIIENNNDKKVVNYDTPLSFYYSYSDFLALAQNRAEIEFIPLPQSIKLPNAPTYTPLTLTYDSNGGEKTEQFTKAPTFNGWLANGTSYGAGKNLTTINADTKVTASWSYPKTKLENINRTGYTLLGFDTTGDGKVDKNVGEEITLTGNITAKAIWQQNPYTIKFNSDGGNKFSPISTKYDEEVTLPTPTKSSSNKIKYKFRGWALNDNIYSGKVKNLAPSGEITLIAVWDVETTDNVFSEVKVDAVDKGELSEILKKLNDPNTKLTDDDLKNITNIINHAYNINENAANKTIDMLKNSNLSEAQKTSLLNNLSSGYLTDADRKLLSTIIDKSSLSKKEKKDIKAALNNFLYISYEEQQKLLAEINSGKTISLKLGDGIIYNFAKGKDGMLTVSLKALNKKKSIKIPNSITLLGTTFPVTTIKKNGFKGKNITSIKIPNNIKVIEASAFANCKSLKKVSISDACVLKTIGDSAFTNNKSLKNIYLPKKLKTIGKKAFYGSSKLEKVVIKSSKVKTIKTGAFKRCKRNIRFLVPNKKIKAYSKLLKGKY